MQRILIAVNAFNETHLQAISRAADGWAHVERIDQDADRSALAEAFKRADVLVGWPPAELLADSGLRFVQLCSAGYDPYLGLGLEYKTGLLVCNARGVFSIPAAEQTLAMMFALTRRLNLHIRDQSRYCWQRADSYRIVDGDTICVVGLGSIGRAIAERCAGVGMTVIGVTRTGKEPVAPPLSRVVGFDRLEAVLPESDHVVLSIPANKRTHGLFNEAMFRRMKPGSCFYNVGRGSLVVEADLVKALNNGQLWGAGLDVFETEPLPADHPFWEMPNVIVVPHTAGRYVQEFDRLCDLFVKNLSRYHNNQPLENVIDLGHQE